MPLIFEETQEGLNNCSFLVWFTHNKRLRENTTHPIWNNTISTLFAKLFWYGKSLHGCILKLKKELGQRPYPSTKGPSID
jgi:hypothetical protein